MTYATRADSETVLDLSYPRSRKTMAPLLLDLRMHVRYCRNIHHDLPVVTGQVTTPPAIQHERPRRTRPCDVETGGQIYDYLSCGLCDLYATVSRRAHGFNDRHGRPLLVVLSGRRCHHILWLAGCVALRRDSARFDLQQSPASARRNWSGYIWVETLWREVLGYYNYHHGSPGHFGVGLSETP